MNKYWLAQDLYKTRQEKKDIPTDVMEEHRVKPTVFDVEDPEDDMDDSDSLVH